MSDRRYILHAPSRDPKFYGYPEAWFTKELFAQNRSQPFRPSPINNYTYRRARDHGTVLSRPCHRTHAVEGV